MYLLFDGQEVNNFLLKSPGQSSQIWQYISLQIDHCNKAVGAAESIQALGYWALFDLNLISQGSQDCTEVPL